MKDWIPAAVTAICAIAALINAWFAKDNKSLRSELASKIDAASVSLRLELANLKNEIGRARGSDNQETHRLISGISLDLEKMRLESERNRSADKEENRKWINGAFMRAPMVEAEMNAYDIRLSHIEKRLDP